MTRALQFAIAAILVAVAAITALKFNRQVADVKPVTIQQLLERDDNSQVVSGEQFSGRRLIVHCSVFPPIEDQQSVKPVRIKKSVDGTDYSFEMKLPANIQHRVMLVEDIETEERGWVVIRSP